MRLHFPHACTIITPIPIPSPMTAKPTTDNDWWIIEQATAALKSSVGLNSKEAAGSAKEMAGSAAGSAKEMTGSTAGSAKEMTGEAKGKAQEVAGEAKGKASELSGAAKGKAEEVKGKL